MLELLPSILSKRNSTWERSFIERFKSIGFTWNVRIGRYVVDYMNETLGVIVELKGSYWHADPRLLLNEQQIVNPTKLSAKEIRERDQRREAFLTAKGYVVQSFWELDLKRHGGIDRMFESILNFINTEFVA